MSCQAHSLGGLRLERRVLYGPGVLELAPVLLQLLALLSVLEAGLTVHLRDLIGALCILKAIRSSGGATQAPAAAGCKGVEVLYNRLGSC